MTGPRLGKHRQRPSLAKSQLLSLFTVLLLGACGIDNDSEPRDIDPNTLKSLTTQP
jgi:hypothetical protein